jgi:hypothetical protein
MPTRCSEYAATRNSGGARSATIAAATGSKNPRRTAFITVSAAMASTEPSPVWSAATTSPIAARFRARANIAASISGRRPSRSASSPASHWATAPQPPATNQIRPTVTQGTCRSTARCMARKGMTME